MRALHAAGRDPEAIADTLTGMLTNPGRAAAMGEAGREWVGSQWCWDTAAARLTTLLEG